MQSLNSSSEGESGALREMLSPIEFATRSGLSLITVRRYLAEGKLPKYQPGGKRCRVMIPACALSIPLPVDTNCQSGNITEEIPAIDSEFTQKPKQTQSSDVSAGPPPRWMKRK